jgi:hypothetical protein
LKVCKLAREVVGRGVAREGFVREGLVREEVGIYVYGHVRSLLC